MVQLHRAETVLPVRSLGETYRDFNAPAPKTQPDRRCLHCPTVLSVYNDEDLCGVCRQRQFAAIHTEALEAREVARMPRARYTVAKHRVCRICRTSFATYSRKRRCCYSCVGSKI
jgi:hypothetical protein